MDAGKCRYITDRGSGARCDAPATEMHPDAYYRQPHPVCGKHKRALVAAGRAVKRERRRVP